VAYADRELDADEVATYWRSQSLGEISRPASLPISYRLLNETHRRLMKGGTGRRESTRAGSPITKWIGGCPGTAALRTDRAAPVADACAT
jgi:hypothetical protein